jgi:hypothetical protein
LAASARPSSCTRHDRIEAAVDEYAAALAEYDLVPRED